MPQWNPNANHGRISAKAYEGCTDVFFSHPTLQVGSCCPGCSTAKSGGKLRAADPSIVVRLEGSPLITGMRYSAECLYCGLCGAGYKASFPDEIKNAPKYDVSCASTLAIGRYSMGLPFYRIEQNQTMHGIPVADATQWDLVDKLYGVTLPAYQCLIQYGSNGNLFQYDDTTGRIMENRLKGEATHTTAFISVHEEKKIHLFFTGRNTAGQNVDILLKQRTSKDSIIAMMDASTSNIPKTMTIPVSKLTSVPSMEGLDPTLLVPRSITAALTTTPDLSTSSINTDSKSQVAEELTARFILCFCLAHGRRKFFEVFNFFDKQCDFVLDIIGQVYGHDAYCKAKKYTPEQRLLYHQTHSAPLMAILYRWLNNQLVYELAEENSGFGLAIKYLLKHWKPLTTFLRIAGAILDNSWAERAIKIAIRHRRNSLFYRTSHGAQVGDCLMSIIYTCQQNNVNALEYLNALQRNAERVRESPELWLPWNYQQNLVQLAQAA